MTILVLNAERGPDLRRLAILLCLVLWTLGTSCAQSDLLVHDWQPGADTRQRSVLALLESRDGYLWVGTGKGLLRFDGVSFTSFTTGNTTGMAGDRISYGALWEDATGAIWAGTDFDGALRDDQGNFQSYGGRQGLPDGKILRIDGDETGAVWIYTPNGIARWRDGKIDRGSPGASELYAERAIPFTLHRPIDFAKAGLWRHSPAGLERFSYGHWATFPTPPGEALPFEDDVREIVEDRLRRVWYAVHSQPKRYFCVEQGKLQVFDGLPPDALVSFGDSSGFLWLTDRNGHPARWKNGRLYALPQLQAPFLLQVIETPDGSVWAGTAGTDLFQFRRRRITIFPTAGAPEIGPILFQQRNGQIWGGSSVLLKQTPGSAAPNFVRVPVTNQPLSQIQITALSEDGSGNLLIAARGVNGIVRLKGDRSQPYRDVPGTVYAMMLASTGEQWIGSTSGLYREAGAGGPLEQLSTAPVRCLFESSPGTVWVGTAGGPLLFKSAQLQRVSVTTPWRFGAVAALKDGKEGAVWMATQEHGAVLLQHDHWAVFGAADGLPSDNIYGVELSDNGDVWLSSDVGLLRISAESLQKKSSEPASKLQFTLFDDADGLPGSSLDPQGNQSFLPRPDGALWFSTEEGVGEIRSEASITTIHQPRAVVEEHSIDESGLLPSRAILLGPGETNLEIHYTALGSAKPEQVSFRYRLRGYDTTWVYAGQRRVTYYSHLPPGTFVFQVQASNNDGQGWQTPGATSEVKILTPFYRTWWWKLLMSLIVVGVIAFVVADRRLRYVKDQRQRQAFTHRLLATQEGERKRIAHELHDSLGQHLVLIRTLAMLPATQSSTAAGDSLSIIADQAGEAIKEVETISYDLRPYQLDRLGLTRAVLSSVQTLEKSSTLKVDCSIANIDSFFPKELEINFYRIVQEALSNVLRHAQATEAAITVTRTPTALRLTVVDNGRGFAANSASGDNSGLGLIGMRERAEALGGRASIESAPGSGTRVTVDITRPAEEEK